MIQAAEDVWTKAVKKFSAHSDVWTKAAEYWFKKGDVDSARELLPRSLKSLDKSKRELIFPFPSDRVSDS